VSAGGAFHFGNLPRNAIIGPTFFNTDLSLVKKTKVGRSTVEPRCTGGPTVRESLAGVAPT